jgi:hypothetical protein
MPKDAGYTHKGQQGTSGYGKRKEKTVKELNEAMDTRVETPVDNKVDSMEDEMRRAAENARGMTDRIRNIFDK